MTKIGVVGAGTMGTGIAQVCATYGFKTILIDVIEELLTKSISNIRKSLEKLHTKGKISETPETIISRIETATDLNAISDAEIIIEAVTEDFAVKEKVFVQLNSICKPETIFASNTSSLPITKLAKASGRPAKTVGMHFMNPVPLMPLVEVIRGLQTEDEVVNFVIELAKKLNKVPIEVNDSPGFVSNRILMPMINEAIFCLYEGIATAEAIDQVMKLGMNHPMGPLALADLIGLDVCLFILNVLYKNFGDPKYRPCPLLIKMVDAGYLGRKSGRGFYNY